MNSHTHTLSSEMSRAVEMSRDHTDRATSLHVTERSDGTLEVAGDIDAATSDVLDRALRRHERTQGRRDAPPVVIDMRQVGFVDSSGLRTLVAASLRAGSRGTSVILRNTAPDLARLLEITGLSRQFAVDPDGPRKDDDQNDRDDDSENDGVNETERRYGPDESPG